MKFSFVLFQIFQYFGPYFIMMFGTALWGILLSIFQYYDVRVENVRVLGPVTSIWKFLGLMIVFTVVCMVGFGACLAFWDNPNAGLLAPLIPMIVLPLIGLVILLCLELFGGFWGCFLDIVAFWRGVPVFRGVLLADLLTSITYAFSGIPLSVIRLINRHEVIKEDDWWIDDPFAGHHYVLIHVAIAIPYLIRMIQCLAEAWFTEESPKFPLLNCLKYFSSIVLQVFSTLHAAHSSSLAWWIVWLLVAILNSLYSWYWDVWRDWQLTRRWANAGLRPNQPLVFKWVFYTWFFLSDLGMRFYWGYKISRSSQPHYSWTAFLYAGIEVLRRSQWAYFRVEREAEEREAEGAV